METNTRYVGVTGDLKERIRKHNTNHKGFTGQQGKWVLIYTELYDTKRVALQRERFLKSGKGREFLDSLAE